jgi:hypothetical protein
MEETMTMNYENQERVAVNPDLSQSNDATETADGPYLRVVGSPLPSGTGTSAPLPQSQGEPKRLTSAPQSGRALTNQQPRTAHPSSLQRAVNLIRTALPLVQRILPLIDGNIATTVSRILSPAPPPPAPAPAKVDLTPIQEGLTQLQTQHRELRNQFVEQNSSLKRVEDQLEMVREATDRNTLEQQELLEDLKAVGGKVNLIALVAIGLLAFSVLVNLLLYMHIQRVLP